MFFSMRETLLCSPRNLVSYERLVDGTTVFYIDLCDDLKGVLQKLAVVSPVQVCVRCSLWHTPSKNTSQITCGGCTYDVLYDFDIKRAIQELSLREKKLA